MRLTLIDVSVGHEPFSVSGEHEEARRDTKGHEEFGSHCVRILGAGESERTWVRGSNERWHVGYTMGDPWDRGERGWMSEERPRLSRIGVEVRG